MNGGHPPEFMEGAASLFAAVVACSSERRISRPVAEGAPRASTRSPRAGAEATRGERPASSPRRAIVAPLPSNPAALVRPVASDMVLLHSRSAERTFDAATRALLFGGRSVATLDPSLTLPAVNDIASRLSLLGSVASHRLLRWEILSVHDRFQAGHPDARVLTVDGGFAELARELGLSTKYEVELKALVEAQARWQFVLPDGTKANLIAYGHRNSLRNRRACLTITVGPHLAPFYSQSLPSGVDRKLVPILRSDPPLHGAAMFHGPQLTMALSLLVEMRSRARELATDGSVLLRVDDWVRLGDRSGIPRTRAMVVAVRNSWLDGSARAKPMIESVGPDRYTLAAAHALERDFLVQGGRDELAAQQAGRRSSRLRASRAT